VKKRKRPRRDGESDCLGGQTDDDEIRPADELPEAEYDQVRDASDNDSILEDQGDSDDDRIAKKAAELLESGGWVRASPATDQPSQSRDEPTSLISLKERTRFAKVDGWLVITCANCGVRISCVPSEPPKLEAPAMPPAEPPPKIGKPKRGWKVCPKCGKSVGTKASQCSCGHSWSVKTKHAGYVRPKLKRGKKQCPRCETEVGTRTKVCPAPKCGWLFSQWGSGPDAWGRYRKWMAEQNDQYENY